MPDREKVIKGIESCLNNDCHMDKCPYCKFIGDEYVCLEDCLMRDALVLLKEQEVVDKTIEQLDRLKVHFELVRCKDCKYQIDRGRKYKECDKHFLLAKDDWFCADGVRK